MYLHNSSLFYFQLIVCWNQKNLQNYIFPAWLKLSLIFWMGFPSLFCFKVTGKFMILIFLCKDHLLILYLILLNNFKYTTLPIHSCIGNMLFKDQYFSYTLRRKCFICIIFQYLYSCHSCKCFSSPFFPSFYLVFLLIFFTVTVSSLPLNKRDSFKSLVYKHFFLFT